MVLGEEDLIHCSFEEGFFGIYWYHGTDLTRNSFLYYENGKKGGNGYTSGEFDVHTDGSLVITTVSVEHNHLFTVVYLETRDGDSPQAKEVEVIVIGK